MNNFAKEIKLSKQTSFISLNAVFSKRKYIHKKFTEKKLNNDHSLLLNLYFSHIIIKGNEVSLFETNEGLCNTKRMR